MVRIEAQNKYVGGGRESEACFLDMTSCVKKDSLRTRKARSLQVINTSCFV